MVLYCIIIFIKKKSVNNDQKTMFTCFCSGLKVLIDDALTLFEVRYKWRTSKVVSDLDLRE